MKNILITGCGGYVGMSLNKFFLNKKDISITCINRSTLDLTDHRKTSDFFRDRYFDIVIHSAVVGGRRLKKDEWDVMDHNLTMYYNLLNYRSNFNKFIHFGSGAEIYDANSPYGFSKSVIRKSIINTENFYNIRIYGIFDENELDNRFIKANIINYINNRSMIIYQNRVMDFFYMKDLLKLIEYYVDNDKLPKEIDCSYESSYSLVEIANMINELSSHKVEIEIELEGFTTEYVGKKIELPIKFTGLKQGLIETYQKSIKE